MDITGSAGLILENDETITNASNGTLLFTAPTTKASAAFEADGLITADANIAVKNGSSTAGKIEFYEDSDDGSHKLTLLAAAMSGDVTLTLPADDGSSNQVLKTDGNGAMSWTDVSSNTVNITAVSYTHLTLPTTPYV